MVRNSGSPPLENGRFLGAVGETMDKDESGQSSTEKHLARMQAARLLGEWLEQRPKPQDQSIEAEETAHELEADEHEKRWKERLKRVANAKDAFVPTPAGLLRSKPKAE